MDKLEKSYTVDFGDPVKAYRYAYDEKKNFSVPKGKLLNCFEGEVKAKSKLPAPGAYNPEKAYKMLSS